jgi:hypothetical protein
MKDRRELFQVEDAKAPIFFGATHDFPIDLALCPGGVILGRPNESALHFIDIVQGTFGTTSGVR